MNGILGEHRDEVFLLQGSSCSGSGRDEDPQPAGRKSPRHHGSLSALSAAWGGGLRLVRSLRKREQAITSRAAGFFAPPLRLRLLHQHHQGSSSTESAPGGSVGGRLNTKLLKTINTYK